MADSKTQNQSYDKHQNMATIVTIVWLFKTMTTTGITGIFVFVYLNP